MVSTSSSTDASSRSGCSTGMPSRCAASFAGGGASCRPRPAGRSGLVRQKAISWWSASRSRTSAPKAAVAATPIWATVLAKPEDGLRPEDGQRLPAGLSRGSVEDEHPVEVVELVLGHPGLEALELEPELRALGVGRFEGDADMALDGALHPREREAALVARLHLLAARDDLRIDDDDRLLSGLVFAAAEDEHPPDDPHLVRGEPHAVRLPHQVRHALDETRQVFVEPLDLASLHAQDGIGVLANLGKGDPPSSLALGVQLLVDDLSHLVGHAASVLGRRCASGSPTGFVGRRPRPPSARLAAWPARPRTEAARRAPRRAWAHPSSRSAARGSDLATAAAVQGLTARLRPVGHAARSAPSKGRRVRA